MIFFYIDESGNRSGRLTKRGRNGREEPDHIYCLTTVAIHEERWRKFDEELLFFKCFLIDKITGRAGAHPGEIRKMEVKSAWLRNARSREAESPFLHALTDEERTALARHYYRQLVKADAAVLAVVVDKRHAPPGADVHAGAHGMLMTQIESWLAAERPGERGLIVMDDAGPETNRRIAQLHSSILHGRALPGTPPSGLLEYPFFTESSLSHGVQLADLCAYNIYRAFVYEDFAYEWFRVTAARFPEGGALGISPPSSPCVGAFCGWMERLAKEAAAPGEDAAALEK